MFPALGWGLLAVFLVTLEVATASFFFLWIGVGAALTAAASFLIPSLLQQSVLFMVLAVVLVAVTRRWAPRFQGKSARLTHMDSLAGRQARVDRVLEARGVGYVSLEGESWRVETADGGPLAVGDPVRVLRAKSNSLQVEKLGPEQKD